MVWQEANARNAKDSVLAGGGGSVPKMEVEFVPIGKVVENLLRRLRVVSLEVLDCCI